MKGEELLLADRWTVRYVATLPREHPQLYNPARPELALPHTVQPEWRPQDNALQWTLPPGVDHVHLPLADEVGQAVLKIGDKQWPVGADGVVELDPMPSPARQAQLLLPRTPPNHAAVLTGPVTYRFEEGILGKGSWFEQGLRWYVGAVRMRQTFGLDTEPPTGAILDLGSIRARSVEARVNGSLLRARVDPPPPSFELDLAAYLRRGDNEVELVVRNTPGEDCGVFGPIRVWLPSLPGSA